MENKNKLAKCRYCDKIATWLYMPSSTSDGFYCDEHVPRGCTCNVQNLKEDGEPQNEDNNEILWWDKRTYEDCYPNGIDPLKFAGKYHQIDSFYYEVLDKNSRRNPCCEYDYSEDGFEI